MEEFNENEERVRDIFMMIDSILSVISEEKNRREVQIRDEMKIVISLDEIQEEENEEEN